MHRAILAMLVFLTACAAPTQLPTPATEFQTFTIDASDIIQIEAGRGDRGALVIALHGVAVFPLDLRAAYRKLEKTGGTTAIETQTKAFCVGTGRVALNEEHDIVRNIGAPAVGGVKFRDAATIRRVTLEMPYASRRDTIVRVPPTLCIGFHLRGSGWVWDFAPLKPTLDDAHKIGAVEIALNEKNVDALGFLFEDAVAITRLTLEARRE